MEEHELSISPFLGEIYIDPKKTWIVVESEFEQHRDRLRRLYMKERDYMPGGFSIRLYGQECFGHKYWDDIVPMAALFEEALTRFAVEAQASFGMPDQPVTISFDRKAHHGQMRMLVDDKAVVICTLHDFELKMKDAISRLRLFLASL